MSSNPNSSGPAPNRGVGGGASGNPNSSRNPNSGQYYNQQQQQQHASYHHNQQQQNHHQHQQQHGFNPHQQQQQHYQGGGGGARGSQQQGGHRGHHGHHNQHHGGQKIHSHAQNKQGAGGSTLVDVLDLHLLENIEYPFCTDHSKYENLAKIGQGTFGEVYKAKCRRTQDIVALKKVLTENEKEGFPITALREIKILQVLRHDNIVRLIEICTSKANAANKFKSHFYLVFEFCEHDLAGLLSNPQVKFSLGEQKKIMQQLLNGLYYIHKNYILHRDMKTANILVTKEGKLKLADFGLARAIEQQKNDAQQVKYTNRVVTLWYRPPELLLGERCYNRAIDMWGAGCIMAELWTREPILKGNTDQNQLELIQGLCGSITAEVWAEVEKLELFNRIQLKADLKRRVKERLGVYIKDPNALDLLDKLLTLDPKKRIDSDEALDHDFFWTEPLPVDLKLEKLSASMFEYTAQSFKRNQFNRQQQKPVINEQHHDRVY